MRIKNLTKKTQSFNVKELTGDREYTIHVVPEGFTELSLMTIVDMHKYAGILEIDGVVVSPTKVVRPTVIEVETQATEGVVEETKEETPVEVSPDTFKCDICGAEFASARGLAAHKNKAHPTD